MNESARPPVAASAPLGRRGLLYASGLVFAAVYPLALPAWWAFGSVRVAGLPVVYFATTLALAVGAYVAVRLALWWDDSVTEPRLRHRVRDLMASETLRGWDRLLLLALVALTAVAAILAPLGIASAVLPLLLALALTQAAIRRAVEGPVTADAARVVELDDRHRARLDEASRVAAGQGLVVPTLRIADRRDPVHNATLELVTLRLDWMYRPYSARAAERVYSIQLPVRLEHYRYFKQLPHEGPGGDAANYALRALALPDGELRALAEEVELIARRESFCNLDSAGLALALVQAIPYRPDIESTGHAEYGRYPLETLVDGEGDCDCHAILAAALLSRLGFDVLLVFVPNALGDGTGSHLAVAVSGAEDLPGDHWYEHRGRKYFYVETTSAGARFGSFPSEWSRDGHVVHRLN